MRSWKTTIGGAFSALGTSLMGIGIVPQLSGTPSKMLTYVAVAGFFCEAIGKFFGNLFAADSGAVNAAHEESKQMIGSLQKQVDEVKENTLQLTKDQAAAAASQTPPKV